MSSKPTVNLVRKASNIVFFGNPLILKIGKYHKMKARAATKRIA
jgi:hypothetical protein